jgi:hypothetical protein
MDVTINVNDYVWVRLTSFGEVWLRRDLKDMMAHEEVDEHIENNFKPKDGWTRFRLYELINIFGSPVFGETVFEDNEISFIQKP